MIKPPIFLSREIKDSDDEMNTFLERTEEENDAEPSLLVNEDVSNRREKIAEF